MRKILISSHSTMYPGSVYLAYKEDIDPFRYMSVEEAKILRDQLDRAIKEASKPT